MKLIQQYWTQISWLLGGIGGVLLFFWKLSNTIGKTIASHEKRLNDLEKVTANHTNDIEAVQKSNEEHNRRIETRLTQLITIFSVKFKITLPDLDQ